MFAKAVASAAVFVCAGYFKLSKPDRQNKKRGIGMFVTEGDVERLKKERRAVFKQKYLGKTNEKQPFFGSPL